MGFNDDCRCCECGEFISDRDYSRDGLCSDCRETVRQEEDNVMDREEWEEFRFGGDYVPTEE